MVVKFLLFRFTFNITPTVTSDGSGRGGLGRGGLGSGRGGSGLGLAGRTILIRKASVCGGILRVMAEEKVASIVMPSSKAETGTDIPFEFRMTVRGCTTRTIVSSRLLLPDPSLEVTVTNVVPRSLVMFVMIPFEIVLAGIADTFLFLIIYSNLREMELQVIFRKK